MELKHFCKKAVALGIVGLAATSAEASFIANFHGNYSAGNNAIFIFGAENTTGTITGNDGFNAGFTIDSSGVFEYNFGAAAREMTTSGAINNFSLLVNSDDPISGIALNRAPYTSDQTNLLDTTALGTEYRVLSYPSSIGTGGQMSVTAIENDTLVTITSPVALASNPAGVPFEVILDAGESVYYSGGAYNDISGTLVSSNQDVAVFSGAYCTNMPNNVGACDHIISQQFSTDNFGTEFEIVENFGAGADGDLVRVLAAENGTEVFMNGVLVGTLNAGEVLEIDNVTDGMITSSLPVTVGQFIRGQSGSRTTGDPAFSIIPSTDQYLDEYVFATPVGADAFGENYLNVALDEADAGSLMLNGSLVDTSLFSLIDGILFGNVPIDIGYGIISAANPFLATTSGFSNYDSYFNVIATSFSTGASPVTPPSPPPTPVPTPATLGLSALALLVMRLSRKRML